MDTSTLVWLDASAVLLLVGVILTGVALHRVFTQWWRSPARLVAAATTAYGLSGITATTHTPYPIPGIVLLVVGTVLVVLAVTRLRHHRHSMTALYLAATSYGLGGLVPAVAALHAIITNH